MSNTSTTSTKEVVYTVRVEFGDCDPAGIVWFPNFFRWIDVASRHFFAECGVPRWEETTQTLGVIAASTWAFLALQGNWVRQPSIAISFLTWAMYLALVCLRVTAGWRGRKAAILTVTVACFSAATWAAHSQLGNILLKP